ncbi:MAG TPA: threonine/serine dehydratase [Streptosporangiaceae bacterium]|jgi:threonine dehydratase
MTTPRTTSQAPSAQHRELTPADVGTVVTRHGIHTVEPLIRPYLRHTPAITVDRADFGLPPGPLVLKLEQLQHGGSFKARGAFANLLLRDMPAAGVVAASGGNHGAAVAFAARALGIPARIYVPHVSSPAKIARIRSYGADLVVAGDTYSDALAASRKWTDGSGALPIHAYDQAETMLGAGTVGMELAGQAPDATQVLASVGGGGLLAGVAAWYAGRAQVVGVEPEGAPTLTAAMRAGRPVDAEAGSVAVDSLAPRRVGELTFAIIRQNAAKVLLVDDDAIVATQQLLWETLRVVAEPGGCAALAALVSGRCEPAPGETVAVVISGANTTAVDFGPPATGVAPRASRAKAP